jgi:8-oxo-dGTP pyrophosphatase MutT (NUDIX family)
VSTSGLDTKTVTDKEPLNIVDKVAALILRENHGQNQMLLFRHPHAGIQIPAGTVEDGEAPEEAVLREVAEETGLRSVRVVEHLGTIENELLPGESIIYTSTTVYARPDSGSFDWARLRKGITVEVLRTWHDWSQVNYVEWDRYPDPQYISMQITGWAPTNRLGNIKRRHIFLLELTGEAPERWDQTADNHIFSMFWAPLSNLPPIVEPQVRWIAYMKDL